MSGCSSFNIAIGLLSHLISCMFLTGLISSPFIWHDQYKLLPQLSWDNQPHLPSNAGLGSLSVAYSLLYGACLTECCLSFYIALIGPWEVTSFSSTTSPFFELLLFALTWFTNHSRPAIILPSIHHWLFAIASNYRICRHLRRYESSDCTEFVYLCWPLCGASRRLLLFGDCSLCPVSGSNTSSHRYMPSSVPSNPHLGPHWNSDNGNGNQSIKLSNQSNLN